MRGPSRPPRREEIAASTTRVLRSGDPGRADLLAWSQAAGVLSRDEAADLRDWAEENPGEAAQQLSKALALREAIYRVISAFANQRSINETDLSTLNRFLSESLLHSKITHDKDHFSWTWDPECIPADRIQCELVRAAANLITSRDLKRVGECADDRGCGYLFIDTSRNHSRRWCNMETCGNRAKAQRHYQKTSRK